MLDSLHTGATKEEQMAEFLMRVKTKVYKRELSESDNEYLTTLMHKHQATNNGGESAIVVVH